MSVKANANALLRRLTPRGLYWRTLLIFMLPLAAMQLAVLWIFFDVHWERAARNQAYNAAGEFALIADRARGADAPARAALIADVARRRIGQLRFLPASSGFGPQIAPSFEDRTAIAALRPFFGPALGYRPDGVEKFVTLRFASTPTSDLILELVVARNRLAPSRSYQFLIAVCALTLLSAGVVILFIRNQIRPIVQLADAAEEFGKGRPASPGFHPWGAREVRRAAESFIDMRERITNQVSQRTMLLAGVSHDLRTPLTRMSLQLALLAPGPDRDALKADVEFMRQTLESYLDFARDSREEPVAATDIAAILRALVESAIHGRATPRPDLQLATPEPLSAAIRPNAFARMIANVLDNALAYGTRVAITAHDKAQVLEIIVDDDGPGIAAADRARVFEAFVRLDPARNLNRPGSGLGLALARDVARSHGGEIELADSPLGGLRVRLTIPR